MMQRAGQGTLHRQQVLLPANTFKCLASPPVSPHDDPPTGRPLQSVAGPGGQPVEV